MVWYGMVILIWICMVGREGGREVDTRRAGVEGGSGSVRVEVEGLTWK